MQADIWHMHVVHFTLRFVITKDKTGQARPTPTEKEQASSKLVYR